MSTYENKYLHVTQSKTIFLVYYMIMKKGNHILIIYIVLDYLIICKYFSFFQ